jgi:hypothetical protein
MAASDLANGEYRRPATATQTAAILDESQK